MLPGGGLEPGGKDEECIIREVAEETGNILNHQSVISNLRREIFKPYV